MKTKRLFLQVLLLSLVLILAGSTPMGLAQAPDRRGHPDSPEHVHLRLGHTPGCPDGTPLPDPCDLPARRD